MSGAVLQPRQVELGDIVIGSETRVPLARFSGFGTAPLRARTYEQPGGDGRQFGREYRDGSDLEFEGTIVIPGDEGAVWDLSGELAVWFDGTTFRRNPREVTSLRFRRPGAPTRVVYGRPDRYDPDVERAVFGFIPWSAIFRTSDGIFYSDVEHSVRLNVASQSTGHIIAPDGILRSPIRTVAGGRRESLITNAGDTDTWPVIEIHGPIADPYVALLGPDGNVWRLAIEGTLQYDHVVVIDTRPWSRGVSLNGGPIGNPLSMDSVPSQSTIPPGSFDFAAGGIDVTGTSEFIVRWRDAYRKP